MKKKFYVFILLLFIPLIMVGCNNSTKKVTSELKPQISPILSSGTTEYKFAIYLVKDLSSIEAVKVDLDKLQLESEPIITEKNISAFYWKSNIFKTDSSVLSDKLREVTKLDGTPFVLIANGQRIYLGTLWTLISSLGPPIETPDLVLESGSLTIDKLNKDGYNVKPKDDERFFEICAPLTGKDSRSDIRIYNALKQALILKE